ncbi:hypothetical protein KF913_23220 [Candidatus Obscuribacterales bacterium]|nr:hypothetical protein [Candidatus Obscuribacterales bacterium]
MKKKINAMLIAGSLLAAGALTQTASAQYYNNYGYGNYYNNSGYYNQGGLSRFINRTTNRLIGTPILGNGWNNDASCGNNYYNGYYNNRPGVVSRIINRIF